MLLKALLGHYDALGDAFLTTFSRPFLLEEGFLDVEGRSGEGRQVHYLGGDLADEILIGRKAPADIQIRDRNVSGKHAKLRAPTGEGRWQIEDLGSSNGTFLNGEGLEPGKPTGLRDETLISLGPTTTYVFLEPQTFLSVLRQQASKREKKQKEKQDSRELAQTLVAQAAMSDLGPVATAEPTSGLYLFCEPFDPLALEMGRTFIIGRSGVHADLVLPHPQVSRRHAEIEASPEAIYIRDLSSGNGVFLGGSQLPTNRRIELPIGRTFQIADFKLVVKGELAPQNTDTFILAPGDRRRQKIKGELGAKMTMEKLLLSIEEKNKSGILEVVGSAVSGSVVFHAGKPYRAEASSGERGADAIRILLAVDTGSFAIDPNAADPGEREIDQGFNQIILEDFFERA